MIPPATARPDAPIVIAGAGIAGLCTAIGLLRAGFDVTVLEQAPELREAGAGVSLAPNATRALASIGVLEAVRAVGSVPDRAAIRHYRSGVELTAYDIGPEMERRWGAPYIQLPRADLQETLRAALCAVAPEALRLNTRVQSVRQTAEGVHVGTSNGDFAASCLLAADGVRSVVRSTVFAQQEARYLGYVAWRSMLPIEAVDHPPMTPDTVLYLGPGMSMLRYKVRGGSMMNVVGFSQDANWSEESWSVPARPDDLRAAFSDWNEESTALTEAMCRAGNVYKWGLFGRPQLPTWRQGRIVLVGDAAHPMLPFLGQGAAMGIEDGVVLARAFALSKDIETALSNFEKARYERTTRTVMRADAQGLRIHTYLQEDPGNTAVPRDDFQEFGFDAAAVRFDA